MSAFTPVPGLDWRVGLVDPVTGAAVSGLASTTADGANVTQGAIADAAVTGDNTGTVNAHLRGIDKELAGGLPAALVGGRLSVDGSGVTQPISAASLPLPTGAALDSSLTTISGKLPAALVSSRLDVNVGKIPGTVSSVNSSTATLLANAVFTGTSEDVSGYAAIQVSVISDQASAANGLSAQWSSDGTNWDLTQTQTISAATGAAITLQPKAQFFRIVYTNGGTGQASFRLQTIYHSAMMAMGQGLNAQQVQGIVASGSAVAGNPFLMGMSDGTNARFVNNANSLDGTGGTNALGCGTMVWDNTNSFWRRMWADTSGRAMVVGAAASNAALAGNPVRVGISDGTNAQDWKQVTASNNQQAIAGYPAVGCTLYDGVGMRNWRSGISDADTGANQGAVTPTLYNNTNFDRLRNNTDIVIQASTATTVQTINTDITTYNAGKLLVHINVSNFNAGNITVKLQWKDANGLFVDIPLLTTGALSAGGPDFLLCLGAGAWPANTATAFYANFPVPRQVRIVQTIAGATVTYSAAYSTNAN